MKAAIVIALLLVAGAAGASAEDAEECGATLGVLKGQLSAAEAKLSAAEATGGSCTQEASALNAKLQQAEDAVVKNSQAVQELERKLAAAGAVAASGQKELQASLQAAHASVAASERQLSAAAKQLGAVTSRLAASEEAVASLRDKAHKEAAALQAAAQEAKAAADSCTSGRSKAEQALKKAAEEAARKLAAAEGSQHAIGSELKGLREEVARVRSEAAAAKQQLSALEQHHQASWVPHWLAEASQNAAASVGPAAQQAVQQAKGAWEAHARPALERGVALAKEKAGQLNAAIEAKAGDSWPKFKSSATAAATTARTQAGAAAAAALKAALTAAGFAHKHALAAWNSPAVAAVRPALLAAAQQVQQVQVELEDFLISLLRKNDSTVPLARRPYVAYMLYAMLVVPLVAVGMPLLGLKHIKPRHQDGGESSLSSGAPMSTKKKKRPAGKAH